MRIKFHGEEAPRVHVSVQVRETDYLFSVRDNGIGIAPEYYDRLFKIFQRLHTREEYPGSGIGLAVCKRIVERHGGRIWIESQVGKGSTIYFTLSKRKKSDSEKMKRYIAQKIETRPVDILLVEDNPGDVRLTKEALKDAKVLNEIYVARDGVEAMQFVHREGSFANAPIPDLILLDLNLPRKDGREVLAEIKKDPKLQSYSSCGPYNFKSGRRYHKDIQSSCKRLHHKASRSKSFRRNYACTRTILVYNSKIAAKGVIKIKNSRN